MSPLLENVPAGHEPHPAKHDRAAVLVPGGHARQAVLPTPLANLLGPQQEQPLVLALALNVPSGQAVQLTEPVEPVKRPAGHDKQDDCPPRFW